MLDGHLFGLLGELADAGFEILLPVGQCCRLSGDRVVAMTDGVVHGVNFRCDGGEITSHRVGFAVEVADLTLQCRLVFGEGSKGFTVLGQCVPQSRLIGKGGIEIGRECFRLAAELSDITVKRLLVVGEFCQSVVD